MISNIDRYVQTVRHLKTRQIYHRLIGLIRQPAPDLRPAPALHRATGKWSEPTRRATSMLGPARFRFLNVEHALVGADDWNNPRWNKLWLYNLHYFSDLATTTADPDWKKSLMARWIGENPPALGVGWEPYPTSLRIVNWIKWALAGNRLDENAAGSLAVQIRFLYDW